MSMSSILSFIEPLAFAYALGNSRNPANFDAADGGKEAVLR